MSSVIEKKALSRRTFLRGAGAAMTLPLLDAMTPALAATTAGKSISPTRMAFVYVPNGVIMEDWTPKTEGRDFEFSSILKPLAPHRDDVLVMSGLTQNNGRALGDGAGDHARASASYLTGLHPRKTAGSDIQLGISVDQVAAQSLTEETPFASLELTLEEGSLAGNCDSGYSCAYSNSMSWRTTTTPNPPEANPRSVFERLFGDLMSREDETASAKRKAYKQSVLDFVLDDAKRVMKSLGQTDRNKVEEYLYAVRTIERRIQSAEKISLQPEIAALEMPESAPEDFSEYARLMFDLQALAFQTDQTRVTTFMLGREGSNRIYKEIGVREEHHGMTHHQGDPEKIAQISLINNLHMQQFAHFIDTLASTPDGDGSLLDHSMVLYGSGISDGNRHRHEDLPVILAGRGGGAIDTGQHVRYEKETPMNNLFLTMLNRMGTPTETLGDSTAPLAV